MLVEQTRWQAAAGGWALCGAGLVESSAQIVPLLVVGRPDR